MLPKASSFNEIVTIDLKSFRSKYVLWIINNFSRFVQGKVILNKRVDTIVNAVMDTWIMCFGITSVGFYTDNSKEFDNLKMDELTARLGVTIRFCPAESMWSNGINKQNHASCDITIKKLMEEKKVVLTDSLVKVASLTHNTNVNKLGYTPLQLMTWKSYNLAG